MEQILTIGITNAVAAAILAIAAAAIARFSRRPVLWYALWLVVLLRLLVPPVFAVALAMPNFSRTSTSIDASLVEVSGGAVAISESGMALDPLAILGLIWAAGALVVIGFAIAQSLQLKQILAVSDPASNEIEDRVHDLSGQLGVRRPPPTVQVMDRVPPMLWAFLGSVRLILPTELLRSLGPRETDTLLAHELAHLSRRDHWVRHLELAALALFWWNPIAWWATKRLRRAQELCCDQRVAELLPDHRRAYADTLLETARFLSGRRLPLGSPARAMADLTQLKGRIQMIMTTSRPGRMSLATRLVAAAILVAVLAVTPILTATSDEPVFTGEPINLQLEDADLNDVLETFSTLTGIEILLEPGVSGTVTTKLEGVPWNKALAGILTEQGLTWEKRDDQIIIRRQAGERLITASSPEDTAPMVKVNNWTVHKYVEGGDIEAPKALEKLPPKYPSEMRKTGMSGTVVAELVIDTVGVVREVMIKESPADEFSLAATEALEQWHFDPATRNGKPVAVSYIVTLKFNLK